SALTVVVGQRFNVDLKINSGTNNVIAQQSYLTFTSSLLQVSAPGTVCSQQTNTVISDTTSFDDVLQNEACNGPANCTFGTCTVGPGNIAYASEVQISGTPVPSGSDFRVATIQMCAQAAGTAILRWQFSGGPCDTGA